MPAKRLSLQQKQLYSHFLLPSKYAPFPSSAAKCLLTLKLSFYAFISSVFQLFQHFSTDRCILPPEINSPLRGSLIGTASVWVLVPAHASRLWHEGFFGKGNLSRGEMTWSDRENERARKEVAREQKTLPTTRSEETVSDAAFVVLDRGDVFSKKSANRGEEHLQLDGYEAIYLQWAVGCLQVFGSDNSPISTESLWRIFRNHGSRSCSSFPSSSPSSDFLPEIQADHPDSLDNPFLIRYVAYHHYRSLGYVVRSGLKYGTDFVLYRKGPVFRHSDFAVIVVPIFEDMSPNVQSSSWQRLLVSRNLNWLMGSVRVCGQVKKTLLITYVTVPQTLQTSPVTLPSCIASYKIKEVVVKRWIPERDR